MALTPINITAEVNNNILNIVWDSPSSINGIIYYELFFTENYEFEKTNWLSLAILPSNVYKFDWILSKKINSRNCKVSIRSIHSEGIRGSLVISNTFNIFPPKLLSPTVISPLSNNTYRESLQFIFDNLATKNSYSQRATYQIYYSSFNLKIDWTIVAENILLNNNIFSWSIKDIKPSNDYVFKIIILDTDGNSSDPVFITNVSLYPLVYFLIDTEPPKGSITIQDNKDYTNNKNVVIKLLAFDETSNINSLKLKQTDGSGNIISESQSLNYSNVQSWHIQGSDGSKYIEVEYKDYAGNTIKTDNVDRFFRTFISDESKILTSIVKDSNNNIWSAFSGTSYPLYKNRSLITNLSGPASVMCLYKNIIYISITDSMNLGNLYKIENNDIITVYNFTIND